MERHLNSVMDSLDIIRESESLPANEKLNVMRHWLEQLSADKRQFQGVERLLRRLENPDVPEDVWQGFEDCEDGRIVELDSALNETPSARGI